MSVFAMAHNLTNGNPTEKDYIQPFTVMAEEPSFRESGTPSPERGDNTLTLWRLRVKPAMTVWGEVPCPAVPCPESEYQYLTISEVIIR